MYSQNEGELSEYIQIQGELFEAVQSAGIFEDSKTFPDSYPIGSPEQVIQRYATERQQPGFNLRRFILENFILGGHFSGMRIHIRDMWNRLYRTTRIPPAHSTLIPLPYPYVAPGSRFQEIYYWDSYFTCLGLSVSAHVDWIEHMAANFAYLIDAYGHVPNGNRIYYLSRSQPPFFCCLLQLLEQISDRSVVRLYLPHLKKEYQYWMSGQDQLTANVRAVRRVVRLEGGDVLNRYWDDAEDDEGNSLPRPESYREDTATYAHTAVEHRHDLYRNIRAAAESGWDFSSRWLGGWDMSSIRTTEIVPVDLNCLLYNLEQQLAHWSEGTPDSEIYRAAAAARRNALCKYCWDDAAGWFCDYSWVDGRRGRVLSLAGVFPLFFSLASESQAQRVAQKIGRDFLQPGGVVTTLNRTGQQWDSPNGWAPLQWITVKGLLNYRQVDGQSKCSYEALALEIAERFVALASRVYGETGKMMEKYDVCDVTRPAGGGEYPTQDGFGWTNGVVEAFIHDFELNSRWGI